MVIAPVPEIVLTALTIGAHACLSNKQQHQKARLVKF